MGEGGGGRGIGKIISGHEDGLDGGNGTSTGSGNTLLEGTKIGGESGLISDSGGDTSEKGGHLGASLGETENVVDEKEHILVLLVTEVFGDGKSGETDTGTGTWGLVHLTVHKGGLGVVALDIDDLRLDHFVVKIVSFTGALSDTSEHGVTTVSLGDVVNQLHDKDGFTDTGTTEKTNLTSTSVRGQKVNDLDTCRNTRNVIR